MLNLDAKLTPKPEPLTYYQSAMLEHMRDARCGALRIAGRWVWPVDVRENPRYAEACWRVYGAYGEQVS